MTTPIDTLIADYKAGATVRDLSARYGTTFQNIAVRLRNAGVVRPLKQFAKRICVTCGRRYTPSRNDQRFCNAQCIRRKTVCVNGHPITEENRYHFPSGNSRCKTCAQMRNRGEL